MTGMACSKKRGGVSNLRGWKRLQEVSKHMCVLDVLFKRAFVR